MNQVIEVAPFQSVTDSMLTTAQEQALSLQEVPTIADYLAREVLGLTKDIEALEAARWQEQLATVPERVLIRKHPRPVTISRADAIRMMKFQHCNGFSRSGWISTPLFSEEPPFFIDEHPHTTAQYLQIPSLYPAHSIFMKGFRRLRNMTNGMTDDTEFLNLRVDYSSRPALEAATEDGQKLLRDDEMYYPLSIVLNARRAVAAEIKSKDQVRR